MIEKTRILICISLFLLTVAFVFHVVAMAHARWNGFFISNLYRIHEDPKMPNKTIFTGIFHRCENRVTDTTSTTSNTYSICDDNTYCYSSNKDCPKYGKQNQVDPNFLDDMQEWCNIDYNPYKCDYSSITKGLISCTIITACTLGLSLLLIFSHILINQFKYKIHMYISIITILLLFLGFLFTLITLILSGSTMSYDLYQYRYNLDYRLEVTNSSLKDTLRKNITDQADREYNTRLDWAFGLEIGALISTSFTIVTQIIYLFSTYRNRIG